MYKDPQNPQAREMPVEDYVKGILGKEKEEKVLDEIKANNPVEVAEDFDIPTPPAADPQQMPPGMMPQQMPQDMPQNLPPGAQVEDGDSKPAPKNAPKPPAPKVAQPKK